MRFTFCFSRSWSPYPTIFALRSRPCCPGAKLRFSIPQDGLKQRSPFRNNFIPSLRHSLQTGPMYLAKLISSLYSSTFRRPAAVVGNRGHVANSAYLQSCGLQSTNCRISARTRSFYTHFQRPHAGFASTICGGQCRLLRGERCPFARPFEAERTGAGPAHDVAFHICDRHGGVVERRLNVGDTGRYNLLLFFLCALFLGLTSH